MDKFAEYVLRLASEPQTLTQFRQNPDAATQAAGLSGAETAVLKSGDANLIRQAVSNGLQSGGASDAADITVVVVITVPAVVAPAQSLLARFR
jgi:hypothetical protein